MRGISERLSKEEIETILDIEENDTRLFIFDGKKELELAQFNKGEYQKAVAFCKEQKGKVLVRDMDAYAMIHLVDGKVVYYTSEHGLSDDYIAKEWLGVNSTKEPEKTRYSIYDVYSEKELL